MTEAKTIERVLELMARGVPHDAAALIADDALEETIALSQTRRWLREPHRKPVLVLAGPFDACKTVAASYAIAMWPWWASAHLPRFVAYELILGPWHHRPTESSPHDDITGLRTRDLLTAALLVLDAVGWEARADIPDAGEALEEVLRVRCAAGLATIITTNDMTVEDLAARYGEHSDRLRERLAGFSEWVQCPFEGFRTDERRAQVLRQRHEIDG